MGSAGQGEIGGAPQRPAPTRLSAIFAQLARDADGPVSIATLRDAFGDRSFAALLVLFAAFNLIPLPPGASAFLGLPLVIVASQMAYGSERAWLPRFLLVRSISPTTFRSAMDWIVPRLIRIERWIKPRYWPFWRRQGDRIIGIVALLLAVVVTLPIPLGNWLPAFATALLGLALIERDGVLLTVGAAVGVASIGVVIAVVAAAGLAGGAVYGWLF